MAGNPARAPASKLPDDIMPTRSPAAEPPCACGERAPARAPERGGWPCLALLERAVADHSARLVRVARHEGLAAEDALDAVQEAFGALMALPNPASVCAAPDDARKLLVTLTRNLARNRRRLHAHARAHLRDDALVDLPAAQPAPDEIVAAGEERARLGACLGRLADVQRAVVTLRLLDGQDGRAVAAALGLRAGNVAVLLHRAKAALAACMDEQTAPARGARRRRI